jgi:hypothetical protein
LTGVIRLCVPIGETADAAEVRLRSDDPMPAPSLAVGDLSSKGPRYLAQLAQLTGYDRKSTFSNTPCPRMRSRKHDAARCADRLDLLRGRISASAAFQARSSASTRRQRRSTNHHVQSLSALRICGSSVGQTSATPSATVATSIARTVDGAGRRLVRMLLTTTHAHAMVTRAPAE